MSFYLLELLGKWISLLFITVCPIQTDTEVTSLDNYNNNLSKDSNVVASVVHYTTITKTDDTLEEGKTRVVTSGVNGLVYQSDSMDITIQEMVPEVVVKGTKKVAKTTVVKQEAIVYDGLTMTQLVEKLNKNLNDTLKGKGNIYAKYAISYGVDPYLAVAISLHETGCNDTCSNLVKTKNNVGGMMGSSGALSFATLDEGIEKFIKNLKVNYYDYGLTTPELMNPKYAASTTWAVKVNKYIEKIKAS
jgi:hypothetical protein